MKQAFNYFDYLKKQVPEDYLDSIQYELNIKVYVYGDQFQQNPERKSKSIFKSHFRKIAADIFRLLRDRRSSINQTKTYAVCGAYFDLAKYLNDQEINTLAMPWLGVQCCTWKQYRILRNYQSYLTKSNLFELLSDRALYKYDEVMDTLRAIYAQKHIKYLFLPQDMSPFELMSAKVFKELGKQSFVFLHGLPGRYNHIDDNRTDYLVVWGQKIKELYIDAGIKSDKIFTSGHPRYGSYNFDDIKLRMGLDNILVIAKSMSGQHSDGLRLADRGNLALYLWEIQRVLKEQGVKSVTFRPHPSMNKKWYDDYIDKSFFKDDVEKNIVESLKKSSMVIGPTSSVFLDALMAGVNYLIYEPALNGLDLVDFPIVPPFDQSDSRAVVCQTIDQLKDALVNRKLVDVSVINDYMQSEFDLSFLKKILQ